jgi:hypothetical protein
MRYAIQDVRSGLYLGSLGLFFDSDPRTGRWVLNPDEIQPSCVFDARGRSVAWDIIEHATDLYPGLRIVLL